MTRIISYPLQNVVLGADKWVGSDMADNGATKNFSADAVAIFLNTFNKIEVNALKYRYQNWATGDVRSPGTISFDDSGAGSRAFNAISTLVLSENQLQSAVDVSAYYSVPLIGSTVTISSAKDPSKFGIYSWNSAAQRDPETTFFNIGLTLQAATGSLISNEDYFISLLSYASNTPGDKNKVISIDVASSVWILEHNLNKYPAVSIVNSANVTVYGDIVYDTLNKVTVTFNAAHTGKAFFN